MEIAIIGAGSGGAAQGLIDARVLADRPFDNLGDFTGQEKLRARSDRYKRIAGLQYRGPGDGFRRCHMSCSDRQHIDRKRGDVVPPRRRELVPHDG